MMRRNKLVFAATTAVLLALLAGLGVSLYLYFNEAQARRAAQESARRARAEADKTGVIKKFLEEMFWANAPGHFVGRDTSVLHEMLDTAAVRVATDFTNQPDVSAELLLVIGENYRLLGDFQKAAAVYRQADEISRSSNPPDAERRAQILTTLGVVLVRLGNTSEAEQDFREAIRLYHAAPSPHPGAEAMPLQMLGMQLTSSRNYAAAEPLLRQALALSLQNKDVEGSAARYNALGVLLVRKQDFAGAEQMFSNSLAVYIALGSTNGAEYAKELTKIAEVRAARGDFAGAEMLYRKALAIDHLIYAKGHPDAISLLVSFGNFLEQHGDRAEAKDLLLEAANGVELGDITNSFTERWKLIKHFSATGDTNQVEQLLQTNYALAVQFPDQAGLYFIWTIQRLTLIWINEQKYPQAERLLLEGWSKAQSVSVSRIDLKNLCQNFIQLYQATGRTNEAALWRQKMRELPRATNNAPAISTNSSSAPAH
jgi:tetratricopeptide (TPR) repeat protein